MCSGREWRQISNTANIFLKVCRKASTEEASTFSFLLNNLSIWLNVVSIISLLHLTEKWKRHDHQMTYKFSWMSHQRWHYPFVHYGVHDRLVDDSSWSHLTPLETFQSINRSESFPDVYISAVARTAMGGFNGSLSSLSATKLGSIAIEGKTYALLEEETTAIPSCRLIGLYGFLFLTNIL